MIPLLVLQRYVVLNEGTTSCAGAIGADYKGSTVRAQSPFRRCQSRGMVTESCAGRSSASGTGTLWHLAEHGYPHTHHEGGGS